MGKQFDFGTRQLVLEVGGVELKFRPLKVKELEGLVGDLGDKEEALTSAIIVQGEMTGALKGFTYDDFQDWPVTEFRKVQQAVQDLNGLGDDPAGN